MKVCVQWNRLRTKNTNNRLGWTNNLRFHVLLNSILVISERLIGDYESLCAMEPIADC